MATVTFSAPGGGDPVQHLVRLIAETQPNTADIEFALERQKTRQIERTLCGTSAEGSFAPYSPAYAKLRVKKGRSPAPVNLLFSGRMQASLAVQATGNEGRIGIFANSEDATKARAHNEGAARLPRRAWMEPTQGDIQEIAQDAATSAGMRSRK